MAPSFNRLVRFRSDTGDVVYGEAPISVHSDELVGMSVKIYHGAAPWDTDFRITGEDAKIVEILSPVPEPPIFQCVGLNYQSHVSEAEFSLPPFPVVFTKPADAVAGPFEDIPINKDAQLLDYEGELCFVISRDCKNLRPEEDPLSYILGYMVGNDLSSRFWQSERSGHQHGYAKSFDKFAPIGPVLSSTNYITDPEKLNITTWVNGEQRQKAATDQFIYNIPTIIRHFSSGRMLRAGTVVMTGTPEGVGAFMEPPTWLKDGDVVEVEIDKIGRIRNKVVFEDKDKNM